MKNIYLMIISVALVLSACADPAANKPKATTTAPASGSETSTANSVVPASKTDVMGGFKATGTEFVITPETSKVEFTGSKVTGKHDGGFKTFKGFVDLVGDKTETSKVVFEIDMVSVFTDADGLTKHLQTGDFFDAEKFPKSTFASTKIVADASKGPTAFTITGDLEMRGVKKSITFPSTITVTPETVNVNAEFSINRKDFGIVYAGKADDLIRDDVVLRLDLKAVKKK